MRTTINDRYGISNNHTIDYEVNSTLTPEINLDAASTN